jgi:hypothetical protein
MSRDPHTAAVILDGPFNITIYFDYLFFVFLVFPAN